MEQYIVEMDLDLNTVIRADIDRALKEARATFDV